MRFSLKWMALPILATGAFGVLFSFAGCSVTSGTVDNTEGGTTTPPPPPPPPPSSGDDGGGDGGATCEGNNENTQNRTDFGADCQSCLDTSCCTELKNCFNLAPGQTDAGTAASDCNTYAHCIVFCDNDVAADAGNDAGTIQACEDECAAATSDGVTAAYDGVLGCAKTNCSNRCNVQ